jgi:DNA-binding transcriptional MerR regulator/methylmalonyl-CoA mutase cobalamin-binding subunit
MYTISQAAVRAGVSVALLRAWERRYGVVRPERTASGYRLYDEAAIGRLRAMRQLVDTGWAPSQAAREIETHGVPAPADPAVASARAPDAPGTPPPGLDLSSSFVAAAAALDERRVEALLDDLFAGGSFERVVDDRVMPALRDLGEAWAAGSVSVAGEHAASHAVIRRLAAAFEAAGLTDGDRPVLVGLPAGSRHEIGVLAFAVAARRRGISVVYLGADVPPESWVAATRRTQARAIVIGIPTRSDRAAALEAIDAAGSAGTGLIVAVGGAGAADAALPDGVLSLPAGIGPAARALDEALARVR